MVARLMAEDPHGLLPPTLSSTVSGGSRQNSGGVEICHWPAFLAGDVAAVKVPRDAPIRQPPRHCFLHKALMSAPLPQL